MQTLRNTEQLLKEKGLLYVQKIDEHVNLGKRSRPENGFTEEEEAEKRQKS